MHVVRYLEVEPLSVKIKDLRLCIGIEFAIVNFIVSPHVRRVFVGQILALRLHAFTARNASVLVILQVLIQISL